MLISNTVNATSSTENQTKAFNLAEAGLQAGQAALQNHWPTASNLDVVPSVDASEYPYASVTFFDNSGADGIDLSSDRDDPYDGYMWIVSQATSKDRTAKVMAKVKLNPLQTSNMSGVAVATNGLLRVNGVGPYACVSSDSGPCSVYANTHRPSDLSAFLDPAYIPVPPNPHEDTVENLTELIDTQIFPATTVAALKLMAQNTWFTKSDGDAILHDLSSWSAFTNLDPSDQVKFMQSGPRVFVVENGDVNLKDIPNTDPTSAPVTVWSQDYPAVFMVMNGRINNDGDGQPEFYAVFYVANGDVDLSGKQVVHGMVVAKGSEVTVSGSRAIRYNANVLANLNQSLAGSVEQVQNTWRQLPVSQP